MGPWAPVFDCFTFYRDTVYKPDKSIFSKWILKQQVTNFTSKSQQKFLFVLYYVSSTLSLLERQQCSIMGFHGSIDIDSQHSVFSRIREGLQPQSGSMWPCQQPGTGRGAGAERLPGVGAALCSIRRACVESPGAMQSQVSRWACDYYFQACLTWPLLHSVNSCFARFTETLHERPFFFCSLLRT